ncbi:MAG: LPP20 family lipoprotein [Phascolarctobacterium sp.]|nr:LPP20 family lipoprotein [Phascolarctobacterium sp.]
MSTIAFANDNTVNWSKGDVTAIGVGYPPEEMGVRGNSIARRAAMVDAQRNLLEITKGVQIDAETTVENMTVSSDVVNSKVQGLLKGAQIFEEGNLDDGGYYVKMRIALYGSTNSLASVAMTEYTKDIQPQEFAEVEDTELSKKEVKQVKRAGYTGVIVDALGLGLESTFSPAILDTNGRVVYGIANVDKDVVISKGMVDYANAVEDATYGSRAGNNPLVIKAVEVKGGKNSVNKVNVVVSVEDADRILLANEQSGMLENLAVVFVK